MAAANYFDQVQKIYIAFYQRPADSAGLVYWANRIEAEGGSINAVVSSFANSPEANTLYGTIDATTIGSVIDQIYMALFNRAPDAAGKQFYVDGFAAGTFTPGQIALDVLNGASGDDSVAVLNKVQVANNFTQLVDGRPLSDAYFGTGNSFSATYQGDTDAQAARDMLKTVTSSPATVLNPSQVTEFIKTNIADAGDTILGQTGGQSFTLTTGTDTFVGTAGNDTFTASTAVVINPGTGAQSLTDTLQAVDSIDGGAGVDTLKIVSATGTLNLPTLSNVEIIEAQSLAGLTINTSTVAGLTNLNVTKAAGVVKATGAAATDVSVALKDAATIGTIDVAGGKDVNVKLTDAVSAVNVGVGADADATGAVVVEKTAAAAVNGATVNTGAIKVDGGTTINVTQKVGNASALVAGGTATTQTQGDVTVVANAATTAVTVKQDAAVTAVAGDQAVAAVAEVASVKFTALAAASSVTVGGLTFTASKALTASEVAQAFANLSASALKPGAATGDTQGAGTAANGVFTGSVAGTLIPPLAGWNSGAAADDTVTFTAANGGAMTTDLAATGATVTTTTQGVTAVAAKGATLGVNAGAVNITGAAALKTVTVDGYKASGSGITGPANALQDLSLSNGGDFNAAVGAATVNLSLENVWTAAAVAATTTTAAVAATAAAVSVGSATTATLNVKNTGNNAANLSSSNATALNVNGSGTLTATTSALSAVKTIKVTETAGLNLGTTALTSVESVDTTGTTGAVTVAIDGTKASYAGGAGADSVTVTTTAVDKAIDLGAGNDRLVLLDAAAPVIKAGLVLEGGAGTDTLVLTAANAATQSLGNAFEAQINGFEQLEVGLVGVDTTVNLDNMDDINHVISNGSGAFAYKLDKMLSNATVELKAAHTNGIEVALKDITGTADVVNLVAKAATGTNLGTVTATGVETINVNAVDTDVSTTLAVSTNTLALKADVATAVNVTGAGNLVMTLDAASAKVAAVDASSATGALTLDLSAHNGVAVTVTGGAGKDMLKASVGTTAKADVLVGGAGNDVLHAGSNGAVLTGGAGNDLFVLGTGGNKEANTYTSITDFQAGDLLELTGATSFGKLTANLNAGTAGFTDYVNAAMQQAELTGSGAHDAVWFSFSGNSYVVLEQGGPAGFTNGVDSIVQLTGVASLDTASFNNTFDTVSL